MLMMILKELIPFLYEHHQKKKKIKETDVGAEVLFIIKLINYILKLKLG